MRSVYVTTSRRHALHPCKCQARQMHGDSKRKLIWRERHSTHHCNRTIIAARRRYSLKRQTVKKDNTLKRPPNYFELSAQNGVVTDIVAQPRGRNLLNSISITMNINTGNSVLILATSLGRNQLRSDALVLTLGHGCTGVFVPSAAQHLEVSQLMSLAGFART